MVTSDSSVAARVRVVVLNFNGGDMTIDCLAALAKTEWPVELLELILVDNASSDDVVSRVRSEMPGVHVIESQTNRGFSGGCNLGLHNLDLVDYVALINNDVLVEPGWLSLLVAALEADPDLGAACPRILFTNQYLDLTIDTQAIRRGWGDNRNLGVQVSGLRVGDKDLWRHAQFVDGFWGREQGVNDKDDYQWTSERALLRLPIAREEQAPTTCEVRLVTNRPATVSLNGGGKIATHLVSDEPVWYEVEVVGEPFDVINNVGSVLTSDHYGADRGYLQPADGNYDNDEDVFAWCGAAVVFPSRYLQQIGTFDERFFLYYEDLELSLRGRERGWRYRYVSKSTVYHHHSATSVEGSALSQHYNERNRLLTMMLHAPLRTVAFALIRYLFITTSYARRDLVSPKFHGELTQPKTVVNRLKALSAALRLAPAMLMQRMVYRAKAQRING